MRIIHIILFKYLNNNFDLAIKISLDKAYIHNTSILPAHIPARNIL